LGVRVALVHSAPVEVRRPLLAGMIVKDHPSDGREILHDHGRKAEPSAQTATTNHL